MPLAPRKPCSAREYAERPDANLDEARRLFGSSRGFEYIANRLRERDVP